MASFTAAVTGNPTNAADINQLILALNGTTNSQIILTNTSTNPPILVNLASVPGTDGDIGRFYIAGDTVGRISPYVRASDGFGGMRGGTGASYTQSFFATAGGWQSSGGLAANSVLATSTQSFSGGNYALIASAANGALICDNTNIHTTGSGTITANTFTPANGNGGFNCRGNFSGTGAGTFSHGAGTTPNIVLPVCTASASTNTVGFDTLTSTQVHINQGTNGITWKAIAI